MRGNPMKEKLLAGGTVRGLFAFEFFTPGLTSALAAAGAEFVILDMEHSGASIETMKAQCAFARGAGIVPMVRVPGLAYHLVAPMLDAGALGIMVPMMETPEQAQALAEHCRYRPEGKRGLAFRISHDDHATTDIVATMRAANRRTLVVPLIETALGIRNAHAMLAVPGIDMGWLGHYDLTSSLEIPGQFDNPIFEAAVDTFVDACKATGKPAGIVDGNPAFMRRMRDKGFRALGVGNDISVLQAGLKAGLDALGAA